MNVEVLVVGEVSVGDGDKGIGYVDVWCFFVGGKELRRNRKGGRSEGFLFLSFRDKEREETKLKRKRKREENRPLSSQSFFLFSKQDFFPCCSAPLSRTVVFSMTPGGSGRVLRAEQRQEGGWRSRSLGVERIKSPRESLRSRERERDLALKKFETSSSPLAKVCYHPVVWGSFEGVKGLGCGVLGGVFGSIRVRWKRQMMGREIY